MSGKALWQMGGKAPWIVLAALLAVLVPEAAAHSDALPPPAGESGLALAFEFSRYGAKHILLGYDHILFLLGLAVLCTRARDVAAIAGLFAIAYSTTLVGGTLVGLAVPGDLIDAVIAVSVGFVGAQIAFGSSEGWLRRDPRPVAFVFGLAHGLGLSTLLQELRLPGDEMLPSVIGFNLGVEVGQVAALGAFVLALYALRTFPFPARERIPAGFALVAAAMVFLIFLVTGVSL